VSGKTFSEHSRVAALNSKITVPEIPHEGVAFDDQRGGFDLSVGGWMVTAGSRLS
jgi:hypothetical protein